LLQNNFFCKSPYINLYDKPSYNSKISSQILYGEKFRILLKKNKFIKVKTSYDNYIGYIKSSNYINKFRPTHKISVLKSRIFKYPKNENRDFIKRVIGIPGDLLEVRQQKVFINEKLINEKYARHTDTPQKTRLVPRDDFGPIVVPPGHLFMMGDNRENSQDSRFWGFLEINKIKGKALVIYWSWNSEDSWVRFDRFGQILR